MSHCNNSQAYFKFTRTYSIVLITPFYMVVLISAVAAYYLSLSGEQVTENKER